MKKKITALLVLVTCIIFVGSMGCSDEGTGSGGKELNILTEEAVESGHLDNPEWDGASETQATFDYSVNSTVITRLVATLTWTDDHSGSDSDDIKDVFSLRLSGGASSVDQESDSGNIQLTLEANETSEENPGLGDTVSVTVACVKCGTYDEPPFIGPFISYWDTGNDFSLTVKYDYIEPA